MFKKLVAIEPVSLLNRQWKEFLINYIRHSWIKEKKRDYFKKQLEKQYSVMCLQQTSLQLQM